MKIQITNLSKTYGKTLALNNIDLDFDEGVYALLGHNGAGKSTLINILSTTLKYDSGEILVDGKDLNSIEDEYRSILGFMPQQQKLLPSMTVQSFLSYMSVLKGLDKSSVDETVSRVIAQVDMEDHKCKSLDGLSGGMKQRVLIAQAILNDPQILLLDEPTAGLDPVQRMNLRKLISDILKNKVVILATHVISDVELIADKIIIMKDGNILDVKTQEELLNNTFVYESYKTIEELSEDDDTVKFVSARQTKDGIRVRFISKKEYPSQVQTTLDDVYLDYLG